MCHFEPGIYGVGVKDLWRTPIEPNIELSPFGRNNFIMPNHWIVAPR